MAGFFDLILDHVFDDRPAHFGDGAPAFGVDFDERLDRVLDEELAAFMSIKGGSNVEHKATVEVDFAVRALVFDPAEEDVLGGGSINEVPGCGGSRAVGSLIHAWGDALEARGGGAEVVPKREGERRFVEQAEVKFGVGWEAFGGRLVMERRGLDDVGDFIAALRFDLIEGNDLSRVDGGSPDRSGARGRGGSRDRQCDRDREGGDDWKNQRVSPGGRHNRPLLARVDDSRRR